LTERLGKDITEDFENYEHTRSARNIMKDLPVIGNIVADSDAGGSTDSQKEGKPIKDFGASGLYGMKLDEKINEKINIDYNKGILYQIFCADFTFNEYYTYINEPKHLINPVRDITLFDFLPFELLTKSYWWMIPLCYIPWEMWCWSFVKPLELET